MSVKRDKDLDIIIPVSIDIDWPDYDSIVECILEQNKKYGFTRFALSGPMAGYRSYKYPPIEHYEKLGQLAKKIKDALLPYGIECGWWITVTIKGGLSEEFSPMVKADGSTTPFSNCPLDPDFQLGFAKRVALYAKIAKPAFIITEDDYSIHASTWSEGCFCQHHLREFEKKVGKYYTREELNELFIRRDKESLALLKAFRETQKDSLVSLAEAIRREVDIESPEIPIGSMQSGYADIDGDSTYSLAKALAGDNHTPFSRIHGTFYGRVNVAGIPARLFNPLHTKQRIKEDFIFYHESDTFPHTRFFKSSKEMKPIMAGAYSFGYDGSTFQTQQLLDNPNEETVFGKMFASERKRFNTINKIAKQCEVKGVELCYEPFFNTLESDDDTVQPYWLNCISDFGIPYTTVESKIAFWDSRQAKYYDDNTIMKYLSKSLFLDGEAAKILCERGYGRYLGVEIGKEMSTGKQSFDLGEREILCKNILPNLKGRNMPSAHMLSPEGNGKLFEVIKRDEKCEVLTENYSFKKDFICNSMTRFENELGGKIVVMGMTLFNNHSQSLLNYRRQAIFHELLIWCGADIVFARNNPRIFVIMNEAKDEKSSFSGLLTVTNLSADNINELSLYLPEKWRENFSFSILNKNAEWQDVKTKKGADGIVIYNNFDYLEPSFILVSKKN